MEFLHACIDEICTCNGPTFQKYSNVDWTKNMFDEVRNFFLTFLQKTNCLYIEEEKMPLEYHELPEHVREIILICLRIRRSQLTDALLYKYSCRHLPTLLNFDWRLKYIMGSSKMATLKEPLLQLDLILQEKETREIFEIELNKDELESFINTIESIAI
ncbi:PREDICTED: COMM domain-containing protein 8-like [Ceratosolen solmsi marchali]|uniref:COMM domain-containing protein 8-like n=1 Tax=Ceratosolen solmsi marchali TaxID=326594 RepID=A0AAJ7DXV2_9HYME|nr:PREDICTED: COMM domain-containing protein 8-like [Ceratosolen solmsi marchali]